MGENGMTNSYRSGTKPDVRLALGRTKGPLASADTGRERDTRYEAPPNLLRFCLGQ